MRLSTRACSPRRLGSFSVAAACWMKAAFLATVSTQVTSICGQAMAITTPGRPPPEPTSSSFTESIEVQPPHRSAPAVRLGPGESGLWRDDAGRAQLGVHDLDRLRDARVGLQLDLARGRLLAAGADGDYAVALSEIHGLHVDLRIFPDLGVDQAGKEQAEQALRHAGGR